jgi:O-antigen/teichoic acid export membrane protein
LYLQISMSLMLPRSLPGSRLSKAAGIYLAANVATAAVPFLLLPILTRHLDAAEYGIVAMFLVLVGIVGPLVGVNVHGAVQRRFYDESTEALPKYVTNCLLILGGTGALAGLLLFTGSGVVESFTGYPADWLWAVLLAAVCQFVIQVRLVIWQAEMNPVAYGVLQLTKTVVYFTLALGFVLVTGLRWEGVVLGSVGASVLAALSSLYLLWRDRWLTLEFDFSQVRNALRFGIPLVPHALAGFAISATDRLFVANMVGIAEAGVYMVGAQVSMGLMLVFTSFNRAYAPWLFSRLTESNPSTDRQIVKLTYLYLPVALVMALGLGIAAPWFIGFYVGDQFAHAHRFVFWLALGAAFNGMYLMVTNYIFFAEKTELLFVGTMSAAVVNVILTYILVLRYGSVGAAQATAVTFLCKFLFTWWLSARVYPMPWRIGWSWRPRLT